MDGKLHSETLASRSVDRFPILRIRMLQCVSGTTGQCDPPPEMERYRRLGDQTIKDLNVVALFVVS